MELRKIKTTANDEMLINMELIASIRYVNTREVEVIFSGVNALYKFTIEEIERVLETL